jgi:hypothetical protein
MRFGARAPARAVRGPEGAPPHVRRWGRWVAWTAVGTLLAIVAVAVMLILLQQPVSELEHIVAQARRLKFIGAGLQALAAFWIVLRWPLVAARAARKGVIREHEVATVVAARQKVAALLLAYVLLVAIGAGELGRLAAAIF